VSVQATMGRPGAGVEFELYQSSLTAHDSPSVDRLPWRATQPGQIERVLVVRGDQGPVWARWDGSHLETLEGPHQATFGLLTVRRRFSARLALIAGSDDLLINGVPALRLAIVGPQDCIFVVKAGLLLHITERFRPFVGSPTAESGLLGLECPSCAIEIGSDPATYVVTCRCGAVYHHETEETRPDLPPEERLNCLRSAKFCLRCRQELTTEEKLVWDPATL
jgi:hypothetical protein